MNDEATGLDAIIRELQGIRIAMEKLVPIMEKITQEAITPVNDSVFAELESDTDELYDEARKAVIHAGKASTSYLQRKLGIGYARAAKLIDMLEDKGVIGPAMGGMPRRVMGKIKLSPSVLKTLEKIEKQLKKKGRNK